MIVVVSCCAKKEIYMTLLCVNIAKWTTHLVVTLVGGLYNILKASTRDEMKPLQ